MVPLYFDNQSTTAVDPRVVQAMLPTFTDMYGNPNSEHPFGWQASALVEKARASVAPLIGAQVNEIEFSSGATASIQRALLESPGGHVITCATEHHATLDACQELARRGYDVTILPVDREGRITPEDVTAALRPTTALVSLMHANNEIGTLHPIAAIGAAIRTSQPHVLFHVDAAQTAGKHTIDVDAMNIDLLSISSHKFHGPKGVGALFHRSRAGRRVQLRERHIGTLNVSGIVGLGTACDIARAELVRDQQHMTRLRDLIIRELTSRPGVTLNGPREDRLCSNVSLSIIGLEPADLLKDISFSSGSACSGSTQSHVLKAIGSALDNPLMTTVRIGLSRLTTDADVSVLLERFHALRAKP